MYVYAIEGEAARFDRAGAIARIDELSGRNIGSYIIDKAIPSDARATARPEGRRPAAYVSKNGPGGFRVFREHAHASTDAALYR